MVAVNDNKGRTVDGAVCPGCDERYLYPTVSGKDDRYGRQLREVMGWCLSCDVGYILKQFKNKEGKWLTYEYRKYIYNTGGGPAMSPVGSWVKGYDLPAPAPVAVGPGGAFVKPVEIDDEMSRLLKQTVEIFAKTGEALVELMDMAKKGKA